MGAVKQFVTFRLDAMRLAVELGAVETVHRAAAVTELPEAPGVVLGVIEVKGVVLPVYDLRRRFGRRSRPVEPEDQFLVVWAGHRRVAVHVDEVVEVIEVSLASLSEASGVLPAHPCVAGVLRLADGLIFIHDLDAFLSVAEEEALRVALEGAHHDSRSR